MPPERRARDRQDRPQIAVEWTLCGDLRVVDKDTNEELAAVFFWSAWWSALTPAEKITTLRKICDEAPR